MSVQRLSSRAIIGEFYNNLEQDTGVGWVDPLSMLFTSDQDSEEYPWLGQSPAMREWIGGRHAKVFRDNGITITNKHFEATVQIMLKWMRRDKSGQAMTRIRQLSERANSHWAKLLSALIVAGESTACYDSQFFFDTDHEEGDSGAQSNDIGVDISELPAAVNGVVTAPSPEEAQQVAMAGVSAILGFVDDEGEPMNENASSFLVMCAPSLFIPFNNGLLMPRETGTASQKIPPNMSVNVVMNARLSAWTDQVAVFRTDASTSPFIRQQETEVDLKSKAEGSEYEFDNDAHEHGVDAWRNVGYGYWQQACLVTMT